MPFPRRWAADAPKTNSRRVILPWNTGLFVAAPRYDRCVDTISALHIHTSCAPWLESLEVTENPTLQALIRKYDPSSVRNASNRRPTPYFSARLWNGKSWGLDVSQLRNASELYQEGRGGNRGR